jgi:tRNA nucleotidyltransferase (CCA-adding enzyme)
MRLVNVLERLGRPPAVVALDGEDAVYVVGGAVRDVLLGRVPHELDFVVEGDAVAVARRAAERLGGDVTVHDRFGTATVTAPEAKFDLAGARRERYERPGALPDVDLGASLAEDLARRDFTVNAIALHLADGELTFYDRAGEDLEAGVLRVLHDGSFRDDPTRLLRLARYAARLGFAPDPATDQLAAAAIAEGAVQTVTGSRLGAELRLLLREPQPDALVELDRRGLGSALLSPHTFGFPGGFRVRPEIVERALQLCPPDARADLVALSSCVWGKRRMVRARLDDLAFPAADRDVVAHTAESAGYLTDVFTEPERAYYGPVSDLELWRALRKQPPETVAVAGAFDGEEAFDAARRWLDDVRHRRLAINGDDLVAAGLSGPAVGEALDAAMRAMLEGDAPGRDEQLAAALGRSMGA